MRHIVVSYYIKATDVKKNGNPFCSKLLHFAYRCQCSCKAKCSNYYILQRYYILGCDNLATICYSVEWTEKLNFLVPCVGVSKFGGANDAVPVVFMTSGLQSSFEEKA